MKIGVIIGSHRKDSQSAKLGRYLTEVLSTRDDVRTWTLDLGKTPLPLWDEDLWNEGAQWSTIPELKAQLDACDGFVVISPEWHGMVPAALKNFFLLWAATGELSHKPALPCAVSAGEGGAYVIAELRMSSYKNNRLCYLPEHLIVRNCLVVMNEDESENDEGEHSYISERSLYCMKQLIAYGDALAQVRASGAADLAPYPNGM